MSSFSTGTTFDYYDLEAFRCGEHQLPRFLELCIYRSTRYLFIFNFLFFNLYGKNYFLAELDPVWKGFKAYDGFPSPLFFLIAFFSHRSMSKARNDSAVDLYIHVY